MLVVDPLSGTWEDHGDVVALGRDEGNSRFPYRILNWELLRLGNKARKYCADNGIEDARFPPEHPFWIWLEANYPP